MNTPAQPGAHRRLAWRLLGVAALSFAFGFALVPFYDSFCRALGIDGRLRQSPAPAVAALASAAPSGHAVRVGFTATVMPGLDWAVIPAEPVDTQPGRVAQAVFRVSNLSGRPLTGRAVPSISPPQAAPQLQKLECFCFQLQRLAPGESRDMPLRFVLHPDIDPALSEVTLAYAFYPARETP